MYVTSGPVYVNRSASTVALVPPAVVTVTCTVPDPAGEVPLQKESPQETCAAGASPNAIVPPARFLPRTYTEVPPCDGPLDLFRLVTTGVAGGAGGGPV